jgi:hypothetical protein
MTARTNVPINQFVQDGSLADPSGATISQANGNTVASPGPYHLLLRVNNSAGSSYNCIVRAGGNGVTASGGTAVAVPFEMSTTGDLTVAVGASATVWIGPFSTDRYTQADGSLSIDFSGSFAGTITAFQLPYNAV